MYPNEVTYTRMFDCSQRNQRVAWWFTSDYDEIGRDYGSQGIRIKAISNLDLLDPGEEYEVIEIE